MLQFTQSDTEAVLIVTLTEKVSITDPYYLFVFTHILTKQKVKFIRAEGADGSSFPGRYNSFIIDPSVTFLDRPVGQWNYIVYEQASSTNTDEDSTGGVLEYGKMILNRETDFEFTKYNEVTSYTTYNG